MSLARAGKWLLDSGIQEPCGGVARFYRSETGKNKPISTEITGYSASALVYLFHNGVEPSVLSPIVGRTVAAALRENGWVGVHLFFILSGYLITALLLREEARYGRIALRAFWVRRILRI